jgi:hypothetical protein
MSAADADSVSETANAWSAEREPREVTSVGHHQVAAPVGDVLSQRQLCLSAALSSGALVICLGSFHGLRLSAPSANLCPRPRSTDSGELSHGARGRRQAARGQGSKRDMRRR